MARVFSQEDGNLNTRSIVVSRGVSFSDIDLSFENKPGANAAEGIKTDIFKKTDAAAVKQAVKNILMTNFSEKPFEPYYGADLNRFLFNLSTEFDELEIRDAIENAINNYEPRALVKAIDVVLTPDNNAVRVTVKFQVINSTVLQEITLTLTRLR